MPDTIVALATPTGRSGIGVIRLSGDDALRIAGTLVLDAEFDPQPRRAHLIGIHDPITGEAIDEAIITSFRAPHSFTGEDVIEMSCHGSPVVLRRVIDICLAENARLAGPGEFSLRALGNGRMDLAEAEAIRDLIDAQTTAVARQAVRQMRGEMSATLQPIKDDLLDVIVVLESALEFVEDDLPDLQIESLKERLRLITASVGRIADTYKAGHLIRDGLRVAIVGRPNVGKSSLFNALLGTDRAIVTNIAGTTRDQLHERLVIDNIPISLIDTAGLRDTLDTVESIGVERAKAALADADLVMVMLDVSEDLTADDRDVLDSVTDIEHLIVLNKIDKVDVATVSGVVEDVAGHRIAAISAKTGDGLDELKVAITQPFGRDTSGAGFLVTDARHHDLLQRTTTEIESSIAQLDAKLSEEIVLIGLHNALRYLGEITGETTTEDMLTRIFSTFCIGK
ncbi:MAG: tRNA uridine-5-carboxymethylaminomethyl(34) synthesis GTPase MnmE [Pyrinomonadaceae bacterium]|nr:tRNA uridine-5-carboxymethylaminomethyl(34) synthesis GTPase MnmE [Pyrinomonadaceae bacterium]